ncbi:hypothetical protein EYV94_24120 [Puteibacter caeruleilacunae]|nr:hypothetical protein EYV94_24120 [Puteibacter caeruleilacunae]
MKIVIGILLASLLCLICPYTWANKLIVNSRYSFYSNEDSIEIIVANPTSKIITKLSASHSNSLIDARYTINKDRPSCIKFASSELSEGKNIVNCVITYKDKTHESATVSILKYSHKPNEVKVDYLNGGLIVDGLPFLPFGFYTSSNMGDLALQEVYNGFNFLGPYQKIDDETISQRKAYMDRCAQLGIKVHYHINALIGSGHNKGKQEITLSEQRKRDELLKKEIETFKDHPALLSWYLNDEPLGQGRDPKLIERAYQLVKELDPHHPVSIVFMMPHRANEFANAMDIAMTDPYPVPGPLNKVPESVDHLMRHFKYQKAVWLVPQAFGGGEFWEREPTAGEIRAMTYAGLIRGAMGIQYFIRQAPHIRPKSRTTWNECSKLALEFQSLVPWLYSGEGQIKLTTNNPSILAAAWKYKGSLLVAAVNMENKPLQLEINIAEQTKATQAEVIFENRKTAFEEGIINEFIDAHGTRIYVIENPNTTNLENVSLNNLTINPGFEYCPTPGTLSGCYTSSALAPDYKGETYFIDSRQAVEGLRSLRVNLPEPDCGLDFRFYKSIISQGTSYQFSVWAKCTADNQATFSLKLDELGMEKTFTPTPEWKKYNFYFKLDKPVSTVHPKLTTNGKGTIWFDLLQLTPEPSINLSLDPSHGAKVTLQSGTTNGIIRYTINGGKVTGGAKRYRNPFSIHKKRTITAGVFVGDKKVAESSRTINIHKAINKSINYTIPYSDKYSSKGDVSLLDGVTGSTTYSDETWMGYEGTDIDLTIDLNTTIKVERIATNFLLSVNDGIHPPEKIEVLLSNNGKEFEKWGEVVLSEGSKQAPPSILPVTIDRTAAKARYIQFKVKSQGTVPPGFLFSGTKCWLFIDEIIVE